MKAYSVYALQAVAPGASQLGAASPREKELLKGNYERLCDGFRNLRGELLARSRKCIYCGEGEVWSLDHFLPRSRWPEYSIHLDNLLPTCHPCNSYKGDHVLDAAGNRQFVNPLVDAMPSEPYIAVGVTVTTQTVLLTYEVKSRDGDPLLDTLRRQFDKLRLAERWQTCSVDLLVPLTDILPIAWTSGGSGAVQSLLQSQASAYARLGGQNDWRVATLTALADSSSFCDRGFDVLR